MPNDVDGQMSTSKPKRTMAPSANIRLESHIYTVISLGSMVNAIFNPDNSTLTTVISGAAAAVAAVLSDLTLEYSRIAEMREAEERRASAYQNNNIQPPSVR